MKIKKIISTCLLIIWMIIIFIFSNQNAVKSETTSDKVSTEIINTVITVTKQEITEKEKKNLIEDYRFLIRKTAHFTLYVVLGILAYITFSSYGIKKITLSTIIFCFIYACSDEFHQLFSNGRTAQILDVFIDTLGGIFICVLINLIKKTRIFNKYYVK